MKRRSLLLNVVPKTRLSTELQVVSDYRLGGGKYPVTPISAILSGSVQDGSGIGASGFIRLSKSKNGDKWVLFDHLDSAENGILPNSVELVNLMGTDKIKQDCAYQVFGKLIDGRPVSAFHESAYAIEVAYHTEIPKPQK